MQAMGGGGLNPIMSLLQDPEFLDKLLGPQALPLDRVKWQEPPKPTEGQMLERARDAEMQLTALNRRFENDLERIRGERIGVFEDHDEDAEQKFHLSALGDEDQLIAALVGTISPVFESGRMKPFDHDEAQSKEDFLYYLHEQQRTQHARAGWGDLDMEITKSITRYGRVITSSVCDFKAQRGGAPFRMKLVDPSIIYPVFAGNRGLVQATLIYRARVADFIGDHDEDGEIEKQLMATKNTDSGSVYKYDDVIEIIEYWDCKWMGVFAAGKLVKGPLAHNYGEPPFVYTIAPYGDPGYTRTPTTSDRTLLNGMSVRSEQADFARRGLSHFHTRFESHAQREAIFGKLMTQAAIWQNEAIWLQRTQSATGLEVPQLSRAAGARNVIPEGFELRPSPDAPIPPTLNALVSASNEDVSRAGLSPAEYGLTPSAQQSGYAIAGLSENGRNKLAPVILTKQSHHALVGEQRLRFYRDWGHLLGDQGQKGMIAFPRAMPGKGQDEQMWEVTPQLIERAGWQVTCHLVDTPDVQNLTALANALGMLGQAGLVSRSDAIRFLGLPSSRNPEQAIKEIDIDKLKQMPEYQLPALLKWIMEEGGGPEVADFVMAQIAKNRMASAMKAGGGQSGAPAQIGPPSAPPPGSQQGPPMRPNGQSGPMMGNPPGTMGGRPPMMGPPPGPGTEP